MGDREVACIVQAPQIGVAKQHNRLDQLLGKSGLELLLTLSSGTLCDWHLILRVHMPPLTKT